MKNASKARQCSIFFKFTILAINDGHRSFFYGESIIENGTVHLIAPFNPIFTCLPFLHKTADKFLEIDEILVDEKFEGIREVARNERILKALESVADVKDVLDVKLYRLNQEKLMEWIKRKFDGLKVEMAKDAHKSLLDCPEAFDRHVFQFLIDYLPVDIITAVKSHLKIQEPSASENIDQSMKRKAPEDDEYPDEKPVVKKPKESIQAKKLQAASKGTKSISAFFAKKN
ncbi:hypothetical protein GCK72_016037 [Caenorhabditis remanei]|uniref:Ribonuclease H2 subunit B wHTH domain-containing protein n=1 Tax=Caenorhabditis remanei TaxID=31234 RepID=A0A6A5GVN6_CAERE|nr:hypothetical protein GCK72_016037 [Caenorhabditis remanei]KAF1759570.1 hypothetical protein GCK72_016037 [Caenorhabditis remanei]